jgi:hypothetical protein
MADILSRANYNTEPRPKTLGGLINAPKPWLLTVATTNINEVGDQLNFGYVPEKSVLSGFYLGSDDLDGATALTYKIVVGGVDVHTGITVGQAASNATNNLTQFIGIKPLYTADNAQLVSIVITTPAGTPQAGDIWLQPVYVGY